MTPSDDLFRLIQSLTPNEKRYFKVFASRHVADGETNYLRLFDAVEQQQEYDEEIIKMQFEGENFIKHLPSEKRYLQQLILKAMRLFHANSHVNAELNSHLDEAWFLMLKGLYDISAKVVKKAETLALKHHRYDFLVVLSYLKMEQSQKAPAKERVMLLDNVLSDFHEAADHVDTSLNLTLLKFKLFQLQSEMHGMSQAERKTALQPLKILYNKYVLTDESSHNDQLNRHQCEVYMAIIESDLLSAQKAHRKIVELWQQAERDAIGQNRYRKSLINLMNVSVNLNDFTEFDTLLSLAAETPSTNETEDARAFYAIGMLKIIYAMNSGQWELGKQYAAEISHEIKIHETRLQLSQLLALRGNLALLYLFYGHYDDLIDEVQTIFATNEDKETRTDIRDLARILECIAHYEKGNLEILDSLTRSAYRYLSKNNRLTPFLRLMINFIKQLPALPDKHTLANKADQTLLKLAREKEIHQGIGVEEVEYWLKSKVTGTNMRQLFTQTKAGVK